MVGFGGGTNSEIRFHASQDFFENRTHLRMRLEFVLFWSLLIAGDLNYIFRNFLLLKSSVKIDRTSKHLLKT